MAEAAPPLDLSPSASAPPVSAASARRARVAMIKRLADVVSLPSSRVNAFERAMTSDLLVEMLRDAEPGERRRVAERVSQLSDIPRDLVRMLLSSELEVAQALLAEASLSDSDLILCARTSSHDHRLTIAKRRDVSDVVSDALLEHGDLAVLEALLRNKGAKLTQAGLEYAMAASRRAPRLTPILLRRPEMRPAQAYVLFWWSGPDERRIILQRFAVGREVLQEATSDVFPLAAAEGWSDPLVRKALQFIERRQRNRSAIEKSPFSDLEAAVQAAEGGLTRNLAAEIGFLSGLKPTTAAKILTDPLGEPLAVLCKATGLSRHALMSLWRSMKRPETNESGDMSDALSRTLQAFDMMAVDRAQTVLRYWNWALSSALTPALLRAIRDGDDTGMDQYSIPERAAVLALSAGKA